MPNVTSETLFRKSTFFFVGCWLLAAGCYWRWLLTFVYLLRAFSHVLETLINGKSAKRHVWNPIENIQNIENQHFLVGCWLLAAGCYWRWLLATGYVQSATGCWLLLPLAAGYWLCAGLVAYNITFVYLLRAFSHVLETLINGKSAKRHVWNPIENIVLKI